MSSAPIQGQNDPYRAQSRRSTTALLVGGVVLALLAGFAFGSSRGFGRSGDVALQGPQDSGSLDLRGALGGSSLQQAAGTPQSATQVGAQPGSSDLNLGIEPVSPSLNLGYQPNGPSTQMGDNMPSEVRDWLKHLEKTENQRVGLSRSQLSQLLTQLSGMNSDSIADLTAEARGEESGNQNYDPKKRDQVEGDTKAKRQAWKDLVKFFNSKQPPAECVPIKNAYEQCLGETSAMMSDILDQLQNSQTDPQGAINKLIGMMGTSTGKIDAAAKQSDRLVGEVCYRYDAFKWFSIASDIGGGLGGLGGVLGGIGGGLGDLLGGG